MSRILVLYVFHILNYRVKKFIEKAIFYDSNVDFVIICNDRNIIFECPDYVKKIYRDNIGYDFGGWTEALLTNNLYKNYDYFIFVNSSVTGPFIPAYIENWTSIYINGLKDNIKLFGSTINTCYKPESASHVQSYIFSMDKSTLDYLIECGIFTINNNTNTYIETVYNKEILMSRKIIENGWNIGSLFKYYKNIDFSFKDKKFSDYNLIDHADISFGQHRNVLWNEYDLVFIKGNRNAWSRIGEVEI